MRRPIIAAIAVIAAAVPAAAVAGPAAPAVPGEIAVTGDHKPYLIAHAEGVQIYECSPAAGGHAWRLLAPRATLTGANGKPLGSHYGGPTWEADDGSTVVGVREGGVSVDPTAVDWLRLRADRTTAGTDGDRLTPARPTSSGSTRWAAARRPPASATRTPSPSSARSPTAPTTSSSRRRGG